MHRIRVDFPEPDGPQITMRSPLPMSMSMSRRTWKSPYHLLRPAMLTMGFAVIMVHSTAAVRVQPAFDKQRIARHTKTKNEVDQSRKGKSGKQRCRRRPDRVGERGMQLA